MSRLVHTQPDQTFVYLVHVYDGRDVVDTFRLEVKTTSRYAAKRLARQRALLRMDAYSPDCTFKMSYLCMGSLSGRG